MDDPNLIKPKGEYKLTEVISIVSHQLKSPISVIKSCLEVLVSEDFGKINEKQKEYLKDALENTERMIRLVKDLLDVSRIEEGNLDFKPEPVDITEITKEVIDEISALANAKNCSINLKVAENIPSLNIDPLKVKQVISNLITNAIEYSSAKGDIDINLERKDDGIVFCCKDTGIGISGEDQDKIFSKFYRSEKAISLEANGSGLGLFISKAIIERSGGEIWFDSEEGKGSTFCFSLPAK